MRIGTKIGNFALDLQLNKHTFMSSEKGYTRINELVAALNSAMLDMEQGRLGAQGLERTTEGARELYERLVVLRHKVREARAAMSSKAAEVTPVPLPEVPEAVTAPAPDPPAKADAPERPSMRLDTRPDVPPRQTSLIDAIAEHEEVPVGNMKNAGKEGNVKAAVHQGLPQETVQPKPAPPTPAVKAEDMFDGYRTEEPIVVAPAPDPKPAEMIEVVAKVEAIKPTPAPPAKRVTSLADRMEHAPIADLGKAISLSQKFLFLAELFGGQSAAYDKAIDTINGYKAVEEAKQFLDTEVIAKLRRSPDPEALSSFMDLVERRFK